MGATGIDSQCKGICDASIGGCYPINKKTTNHKRQQ